jgi:hypothetical protein
LRDYLDLNSKIQRNGVMRTIGTRTWFHISDTVGTVVIMTMMSRNHQIFHWALNSGGNTARRRTKNGSGYLAQDTCPQLRTIEKLQEIK